ncbi:MAG: 30S ribosomal protein S18 [candidate division TM6 bacterium GW2011_GWF2_32_72]|nr:MAG: 30S ribosomal protein S18 [candidate division TM6 bacterium GW2011_GWF2_32_72]
MAGKAKQKIKLRLSSRLVKKKTRRKKGFNGAKHCRFCGNAENLQNLDYKNTDMLKHFLTESGKILTSKISGNCAKHQRELSSCIRKARTMALIPYTCAG